MSLSSDLISQFVKVMKTEKKADKETTVYGKTVEYNGSTYVQLDGSDLLTPVSTTADTKPGERVSVLIKNHTATVTGNVTSPAARTGDVKDLGNKITEVEILIADKVSTSQLEAESARIDTLVSENVTIRDRLTASEADIDTIQANNVTISGKMTAAEAAIENLKTTKISAEIADAKYATIENLEATNVEVNSLKSTYGEFKDLATNKFTAIEADIKTLDTEKLSATTADAKYATIDFSNIGKAAIEQFYATSGIIKDLVVGDTSVTGKLVGVTITGDLIEGGTVKADKLVVLGTDGLYYKLNTDGVTTTAEQTEYNSLNGSVITAKSITAEKVNVDDLVAFDATIGGFNITESAIYSGVKESATNTTRGIYLDKLGQLSVGDTDNFIRYYKDQNGEYKLEISASSILMKVGGTTSNLETTINNIDSKIDNVKIGGRNYILNSVFEQSMIVYDSGASGWACPQGVENASIDRTVTHNGHNTFHKSCTYADDDTWYESNYYFAGKNCIPFNPNETWTLSLWIYIETIPTVPLLSSIRLFNGNWVWASKVAEISIGDVVVTEVEKWTRVEITFNTPSTIPTYDRGYIMFTNNQTTDCYMTEFKLEKGSKATDWTPAPEDVDNDIDESVNDLQKTIDEQDKNVVDTCNKNILNALDGYVQNGDYDAFRETVSTQLSILADRIEMNFTSTTESINSTNSDVQARFTELSKYFNFGVDGLEIGSGENTLKLTLDNGLLCFEQNGVVKGWWDGVDFHTGNIMVDVSEKAQFGNFAFVPRSDGSLMFLKIRDLVSGNNLFSLSTDFCEFESNVTKYKLLGDDGAIVYISSTTTAAIHFELDPTKTYKISYTSRNASLSGYDGNDSNMVFDSDGSDGTHSLSSFTGVGNCYFYPNSINPPSYMVRDVLLQEVTS